LRAVETDLAESVTHRVGLPSGRGRTARRNQWSGVVSGDGRALAVVQASMHLAPVHRFRLATGRPITGQCRRLSVCP
jgi:hypothetical protein